jgi:hypothetical protein
MNWHFLYRGGRYCNKCKIGFSKGVRCPNCGRVGV